MRLASEFLDGDAGVGTCALCLKEHVSLTDEHIFGCSGKCGTVSGGMRSGWLRKVA